LLSRLYDLRKRDPSPISGADTMAVVIAGMTMPKNEFNDLLESALGELEAMDPPPETERRPRLLVTGSPLANPEEIKLIEDLGGLVAADDLCTGIRYFWNDVDPDGEPIEAISRRYLTRIPCPRMLSHKGRQRGLDVVCLETCPGHGQDPESVIHDRKLLHDVQLIKDYRVDGVIYTVLKFCSPWLYTFPAYRDDLREILGIPILMLQREYAATGMAQMRTRVGAFLEMLR
ncbi:MAG: 2-hydroxyacyl-CoA dehydratase family protein, partial [Desulfatiglandales bacterium]